MLVECAPLLVEPTGEVSEWSNVPDSKSGVALCVTVGSNPTLSATQTTKDIRKGVLVFWRFDSEAQRHLTGKSRPCWVYNRVAVGEQCSFAGYRDKLQAGAVIIRMRR